MRSGITLELLMVRGLGASDAIMPKSKLSERTDALRASVGIVDTSLVSKHFVVHVQRRRIPENKNVTEDSEKKHFVTMAENATAVERIMSCS